MAQNLLRFSNQLDRSVWTPQLVDVVSQIGSGSPTGRYSRSVMSAAAPPQARAIWQRVDTVERQAGQPYTLAVWIKAESFLAPVTVQLYDLHNLAGVEITVHSSTGAVISPAHLTTGSDGVSWSNPAGDVDVSLGNGWYKIWLRGVTSGSVPSTAQLQVAVLFSSTPAAGSSLLVGGAVLHQSEVVPSFVETLGRIINDPIYEVFDFPMHRFATEYPDNSTRVQFNKGRVFSSRPTAAPQRTITLTFEAMVYMTTPDGVLDIWTHPEINLGRLEDFYRRNQLYSPFVYDHPVHGRLVCQFQKPLNVPKGMPGGQGAVGPIEVTLIEQPASGYVTAVATGATRGPVVLLEDGNRMLGAG